MTPITSRITQYEGNLRANQARLKALENNMDILHNMLGVLESFRDRLTGTEGHLPTNADHVKEKEYLNVAIMTLSRVLNGLLQMVREISRAMDHPEHAHVIENQDEEAVSIKEEEKTVPKTHCV